MAFHEVDHKKKVAEREKEILAFWRKNKTFEKSIAQRNVDNSFVFYDGPPFITGDPHYGTLLSSIVKDVVGRFWTMKGKRVERTWGWDCHGLPAENLVEKKLGIKDKRDVEKIGLQKYIETCHSEMVQGGDQWEEVIERIGRWVEFQGAYKTMDKDYMESVWWAFKTLYEKGKIYEGEKVLMYCTRCATPISKAEVAMDNSYKVITDPSVYVKFPVVGEDRTYFLVWTTTPWTLQANTALAVHKDIDYVKVQIDTDQFILAKETLNTVLTDEKHVLLDFDVLEEMKGAALVGKKYKPLFIDRGEGAHVVVDADYITTESGTGLVHLAPAYGEEDFELAQAKGIPSVHVVDENGEYTEGDWQGKNIWDENKIIAKELKRRGVVWKIDYITHEYPHCHRCDTKLMYRAHPSWFIDIAGQRDRMLEKNENINWFPEHIKHKRFKNIVETAPDWNLSRDRFWATAFPVWKCQETNCGAIQVIGSYEELYDLSGEKLDDYHRPYVDAITFSCKECSGIMKRIEKVLDCWFESGCMPFAQFHYPFENKEKFEQNFPGDFITEYIGQVRAWFYYLHAVSIGLFGEEAFKNVIVTGTIAGNDGKKMSKSLGNYTNPSELLDQYSSDALRYTLISSPLLNGEDYTLVDKDVADTQRKLATLWQSYSFFVMYANVDGWQQSDVDNLAHCDNILDRWIIGRLHQLISIVDKNMLAYNISMASKPCVEFIDDLSNWYIRRSRKRFWKSEDDGDKDAAYTTLHYVLVELSKVMAPFTPFMSEEIYRNLTDGESVHLEDFPQANDKLIDEKLITQMAQVRSIITEGLKLRAQAQIKVRQPLAELYVVGEEISDAFVHIVMEEVNVKNVSVCQTANKEKNIVWNEQQTLGLNCDISEELKLEGQAREIIRIIQQARKKAGFEVDDRIVLGYNGMEEVFAEHGALIAHEILATEIKNETLKKNDYEETVTIDGKALTISLKKEV